MDTHTQAVVKRKKLSSRLPVYTVESEEAGGRDAAPLWFYDDFKEGTHALFPTG